MTHDEFMKTYSNSLYHEWATSKDPNKYAEQKKREKEYNAEYYRKHKEKWNQTAIDNGLSGIPGWAIATNVKKVKELTELHKRDNSDYYERSKGQRRPGDKINLPRGFIQRYPYDMLVNPNNVVDYDKNYTAYMLEQERQAARGRINIKKINESNAQIQASKQRNLANAAKRGTQKDTAKRLVDKVASNEGTNTYGSILNKIKDTAVEFVNNWKIGAKTISSLFK